MLKEGKGEINMPSLSTEHKLPEITIPEDYNYLAFFISLNCNLKCHYCINLNDKTSSRKDMAKHYMSGSDWAKAINRLYIGREDLPVTLQGGEPTIHKDFYQIVNETDDSIKLDLLTNMAFNPEEFIKNVPAYKFTREAKYAAIRVSYHPGYNDIDELIRKTLRMAEAGFYVGIYSVLVPENREHIDEVMAKCNALGIDFRVKEYLGFDGEKWHGEYKYIDAISQEERKSCMCKTTELIVGPTGHIFRCHSDLYANRCAIGHILDHDFKIEQIFRPCDWYGFCNPCDIKVKTNRFQIFGHTSVEIEDIHEL
jgi:MoaA/NifB/PqqE/SkfB family radical SAM enzyme